MSASPGDAVELQSTIQPDPTSGQPPRDRIERHQQHVMNRRTFMRRAAAAGIVAGTAATGGSMTVAAISGELNFASELVQNPRVMGSVTVRRHEEGFEELDFVPDGTADRASLSDLGGQIQEQDEDDADDDVPWNPVTLQASNFRVNAFTVFPRGEEYEDADGDDVPLNWIDGEEHWETETEGADPSISVSDESNAVTFSADNVQQGEHATAIFEEFEKGSGLGQSYLQLVLDVNELNADGVVEVAVLDAAGNDVVAVIDPNGDVSDDGVIATATGDSIVYQTQFADLDGINDLDEFDSIEIRFKDADASITVYGLDVENPSRWNFGTREYLDADDDLDTETVREPAGEFSIVSVDTIGVPMEEDDYIADVEYLIELRAEHLDASMVDYEIVDAERHGSGDLNRRFRGIINFEPESHFDLIWNLDEIVDVNYHTTTAWIEAGFEAGLDDPVTLEDYDDDELELTPRTAEYRNASIDDEVNVTSAIAAGEVTALYFDHLVTPSDEAEMTQVGVVVAPTDTRDRGVLGWLFSLPGLIASAVTVIVGSRVFSRFRG